MKFSSTRSPASAVSLSQAIAAGLAPDGGLYLPNAPFSVGAAPATPTIAASGQWILEPVFAGDELAARLPALCTNAFSFDAPLRPFGDDTWLLELFHGPTSAFKDFGARFLAECLSVLPRAQLTTILVATSGDTGAAVAAAFHRRAGFRVVILYPDGRVSQRQAHQLGAFGDNISTFRVAGTFDDCQRMVKAAFSLEALRANNLGSANSISLGRLLPQMAYYAHAARTLGATQSDPMNVVVPTGNLGNAVACVLARRAGVAIGRVVLATNSNRVLPDFFATETYEAKPSLATLANAMDVGAPSNVERLRALYPSLSDAKQFMAADWVDDATIRETIRATHARFGLAICPHTACGVEVLRRVRAQGATGRWIVASTAHAAKFADVVEPLIGREVVVPPALAELLAKPAHAAPLEPSLNALREVLA